MARYLTGFIAIVSRASICSVTFIVPSSAAIDAPTRPAITIPVKTGPSSVMIALLVAAPRNDIGATPFNWYAACHAATAPVNTAIMSTKGSELTPICSIW